MQTKKDKGWKVTADIFNTYDVKFRVVKTDIVFPPALHPWYIYGAKFMDRIRLLVNKLHF